MALMRFRDSTVTRLVAIPESGMGFQIVMYRKTPHFVFNAQTTMPFWEFRERRFNDQDFLSLSGVEGELALPLEYTDWEDGFELYYTSLGRDPHSEDLKLNSSDNAIEPPESIVSSKIPYSYYRFCAFVFDRRVEADGSFRPGTYATTYSDIHHVPSGFAAVGRYALPNPASARFVHQIVTFERPTLMGAAAPNYGQAGGGVEVLFAKGAKNGANFSFRISAA